MSTKIFTAPHKGNKCRPLLEFYGAEDLAAKLLELSKTMANDWRTFARAVEDGGKEAAVSA